MFIKFKVLGEEPLVDQKRVQTRYRGKQSGFEYAEAFKFIGPWAPLKLLLPDLLGEDVKPAGPPLYPWGAREYIG